MAESVEWDSHQKEIIEATADFKLVAEAGPGTGKTEVACARVASLISTSLEPENILIFSFTRTAVTEIRNRIRDFSGDDRRASGVRITTLDSQVWHLCQGFLEDGAVQQLFGSYEANVVTVLDMLRKRSVPLMEHLSRYRHVVIDEAQDLVNIRAEFSIEFLRCLPKECGVSVFADGAQAIYGFTNEVADGAAPVRSLLDLIKEDRELSAEFYFTSLDRVYRAGSPGLLKLFNGTRELVKSKEIESKDRLEALKTYIAENAGPLPAELSDKKLTEMSQQKMLLLFRRRVEVLLYSSLLYAKKIPHRIRMGNQMDMIAPWVGALFAEYCGPPISEEQFGILWEKRFGGVNLATLHAPSRDEAWTLLKRYARGINPDLLLVKNLRRVLTRSRPPHEFCMGEAGLGGLTLGTIHASKGREASDVGLMMPKTFSSQENDGDEESRVLYVAATRAKKNLHVGTGFRASGTSYLEGSNRIYRIFPDDQAAQVEFGIANDFDPSSVISLRDFPQTASAKILQTELIRNAGSMAEVILRIPAEGTDFDYRVLMKFEGGSNWFLAGRFHQNLNIDLFAIGKQIGGAGKLKPSPEIRFLQFFSLQTMVIPEDAPNLENFATSFSNSGFFVAPVIRGFSKVYFRNYMGK